MLDEEKLESNTVADFEPPKSRFSPRSFLGQLSDEVDTSVGALALLACSFATGLTDGTLYNGKRALVQVMFCGCSLANTCCLV